MIEITMQPCRSARIAHTGENEAVRVAFSLSPFEEAFPGGRPALLVRRKGDTQAYPVTLTVEGDTAYWMVTAADTAAAGFGQCELQWYAGNTLAKSDKFDFLVVQALEAGAEPPDAPSKRWFDAIQGQIGDLNDLSTKAKENLVAAINEAARSGGGSGGAGTIDMRVSDGYIQYSNDDGTTWENLIAVADLKGADGTPGTDGKDGAPGKDGADGTPGADGYSPIAKVEETADGAKITITDKTGTTEATVKNGKDGKDGADGTTGADGYSPEATVTPINGGAKIIIKDKNGTTSANVMNGTQGPKGDPGADYVLTDADKAEIADDVIADGIEAQLGDEPLPAPASASVGQFIRAKTVVNGKVTETEAADVSGGGGGETWELIKHITVPDGAAETNALTINTDESGNAFSLKKAKIFGSFPKYTGASTIPTFSFFMLNGIASGNKPPYCYTSGWVVPAPSKIRTCSIEVDLTNPELQIESVTRNYSTTGVDYFGPQEISAVTSIGGTNMLIYPGCEFWLYGVRA